MRLRRVRGGCGGRAGGCVEAAERAERAEDAVSAEGEGGFTEPSVRNVGDRHGRLKRLAFRFLIFRATGAAGSYF